jgi:hypothetical protein
MGHNDHIDDQPDLPPEAGTHDRLGFQPDDDWLERADPELRHAAMRAWFLSRYWDPANETPYNGREGGYQYIHGGPYDADEELSGRFGHLFEDDEIREVVDNVESDGILEWAPIHTEPDYDADFEFEANKRSDPYDFLKKRLNEVDALAAAQVDPQRQPLLRQLLYSSLIAALEAYLADTMSYWVAVDKKVFRRFVGSCEEFRAQKLTLSQIFERMDALEDDVERYLQQLVWHRLDKVVPLLSDSLNIGRPEIGELMKHILIRHDIVHRGGKTKDGNGVNITDDNLSELRGHVLAFADEIEAMLLRRFPIVDPSNVDDVVDF